MDGGEGNDSLDGGSGNDVVLGGDGRDKIKGGSGNDVIDGGNGNDTINAGSGDDTIDGGSGVDRFFLGAGDDVASGGAGADTFIFRTEDASASDQDVITDFTLGEDILDLTQLELGGTAEDWLASNASLTQEGSVEISIGQATLTLLDHQDLGEGFLAGLSDQILI